MRYHIVNITAIFIAVPLKIVNKAFLLIKPHANRISVHAFLRDWFNAKGFRVIDEEDLSGPELALKFSRQYSELGRRAEVLKPNEYFLSTGALIQFQKRFGISWSEAIEQGLVRNATDTASLLDVSVDKLNEEWQKCVMQNKVLRFDRAFYCGLIDTIPDKPAIFCVNGFFPSMRAQFSSSSASVHVCSVEWDNHVSWKHFRTEVVGTTDPATSPADSLRHIIYQEWKEFGLETIPTMRDNAVHVSASAFEAFAERCNWLGESWMSDPLGSRLFSIGLTPHVISDWIENVTVKGKKVFDHMENLGCQECLDRVKEIYSIADVAHSTLSSSNGALIGTKTPQKPSRTNVAFVYFKPHANSASVISLARDLLSSRGFVITDEGDVSSRLIEKECLLDKQCADIARKAVLIKPNELVLTPTAFIRFQKKFKITWADALADGVVFNAVDATIVLEINYASLNEAWVNCINNGNMVKFGRGCYCGLINTIPDRPAVFCINGFYMHMRAQYIAPGASIHYFSVQWEDDLMSWESFRRRVIGSANPFLAHAGSLRSIIALEWKELNLSSEPNMENNGIHGSASAFEAFVERWIWLNDSIESDPFACKLLDAGIPKKMLHDWVLNATIAGKPIFDHMENKGTEECVSTAVELYTNSGDTVDVSSPAAGVPLSTPPAGGVTLREFTSPAGRLPPIPTQGVVGPPLTRLPQLSPLPRLTKDLGLEGRRPLSSHAVGSPSNMRTPTLDRFPTSTQHRHIPTSADRPLRRAHSSDERSTSRHDESRRGITPPSRDSPSRSTPMARNTHSSPIDTPKVHTPSVDRPYRRTPSSDEKLRSRHNWVELSDHERSEDRSHRRERSTNSHRHKKSHRGRDRQESRVTQERRRHRRGRSRDYYVSGERHDFETNSMQDSDGNNILSI